LVYALRAHALELRRRGVAAPQLSEFTKALERSRIRVTSGQAVTDVIELEGTAHTLDMRPVFVNRSCAAALLSVSERTVTRLVADGRLKAIRLGGAVRYRVADLEAFGVALAKQTDT
jgi:excisionase family DNA binding protein